MACVVLHGSGVAQPHLLGTGGMLKLVDDVGGSRAAQVLSVIKWDSKTRKLSFILPEKELKKMKKEGWTVVLWRSDAYQVVSYPTPTSAA